MRKGRRNGEHRGHDRIEGRNAGVWGGWGGGGGGDKGGGVGGGGGGSLLSCRPVRPQKQGEEKVPLATT